MVKLLEILHIPRTLSGSKNWITSSSRVKTLALVIQDGDVGIAAMTANAAVAESDGGLTKVDRHRKEITCLMFVSECSPAGYAVGETMYGF